MTNQGPGTPRRVRYVVAMSLDGYIAGPDDDYDWIPMDPAIDFEALFEPFDTVLAGRRSYEVTRGSGHPPGMPGMKTWVFSSRASEIDDPDVEASDDPVGTVSALLEEPGKDLWLFGGGLLFRTFLEAGLVDTVEIAVVPILLGDGIPMLPSPGTRVRLELTDREVYPSGIVSLSYDVVRDDAGASGA